MNWIANLISGRADPGALDPSVRESLAKWMALPEIDSTRPHFETRYTVVNTEATGLNLDQDKLLSVAAIAVNEGLISPSESYYANLEPNPAATLTQLLSFAGKGPLVVYSAGFNRTMLDRAFAQHLGFTPDLVWLDLYILLPALYPEKIEHSARLADWMKAFGIETFQRHHALGNAWVISQLLIAALSRALATGSGTAHLLTEIEHTRRQTNRPT